MVSTESRRETLFEGWEVEQKRESNEKTERPTRKQCFQSQLRINKLEFGPGKYVWRSSAGMKCTGIFFWT